MVSKSNKKNNNIDLMVLLSGYRGVVKIFEFWSLTRKVEGTGFVAPMKKIFWVGKLLTIEEIFGGV